MSKKKVVIVGGGTGTHTVLRGLKKYTEEIELSAIVSMADSGGSTGRLRDEFGQLPAGDVRNALTALAAEGNENDILLRQLFMYRFSRGEGLYGHNFGNLFLTVLTDLLGSEVAAIAAAARILRVEGQVVPVTTANTHLVAEYENGAVITGEHDIDTLSDPSLRSERIARLSLSPAVGLYSAAAEALIGADIIVFGPGDLYTSVLANCVVGGFTAALQQSQAKIVYVCNLMSKAGQTVGMDALHHLAEITAYSGREPHYLLLNDEPLPADLLGTYAEEGMYPVDYTPDLSLHTEVLQLPLLAEAERAAISGDTVVRSLIRHDSDRLATALMSLLFATH